MNAVKKLSRNISDQEARRTPPPSVHMSRVGRSFGFLPPSFSKFTIDARPARLMTPALLLHGRTGKRLRPSHKSPQKTVSSRHYWPSESTPYSFKGLSGIVWHARCCALGCFPEFKHSVQQGCVANWAKERNDSGGGGSGMSGYDRLHHELFWGLLKRKY